MVAFGVAGSNSRDRGRGEGNRNGGGDDGAWRERFWGWAIVVRGVMTGVGWGALMLLVAVHDSGH